MTDRVMALSKDVDCPICTANAGEDCYLQGPNGTVIRDPFRGHQDRAVPAPACPLCGVGAGEQCVGEDGQPLGVRREVGPLIELPPQHAERFDTPPTTPPA